MKIVTAGAVAAALFASAFAAQAQGINAGTKTDAGVSASTPGHKMQTKGSVKGTTGASGYAPGQQMQTKGSVKGTTGASGYAPGHTGANADINGNANIGGSPRAGVGVKGGVK